MKISIRQKLIPLSFIMLASNGFIGYVVYKSDQKLLDSEQWVQHTEQVIFQSGNIRALGKDIETASMGFVITNDKAFLEPLYIAPKTAFTYIKELKQLTLDNPAQQKRIDSLNFYLNKRLDFSFQTIELRKKQGFEPAIAYISTEQGKYYSDHINQLMNAIQKKEITLLEQRRQINEHSIAMLNRVSVVMFILMAAFTILWIITIGNYLLQNKKKEEQAAELVITNKKLAFQITEKEKLEEKQALFMSMVNSSDDAILSKNLDGIITSWNQGAEKIFGYSPKEIIGKPISIIIPASLLNEENELLKKIQRGEIVDPYETERIRKDGESIYVSITVSPIKDSLGNIIAASKILRDITQKRHIEEQLAENIKQLEASNIDLESFSYSVSHDLRAPLRAINGYARMLKESYETQLDSEANRLMNNIINNAKKMGQLIDDLLTFSRLGRKELVSSLIPMNELVTNLCSEFKNELSSRDIEFIIKPLLSAQADNITIKQVWLNLISNAIKYSKLKDKTIIEITSEIKGDEIIYSIKDNGAGFDMRYASKLFGVFQRLHSNEEFEGTGVGLAIVQRIILKHGGRVWAESKVNEGAKFFFTLINYK
jgi:PAS domain S-box-containing protein